MRHEQGIVSTREPYVGPMAPPVEVRRDAFARWVRRVLAQAKDVRGLGVVDIAKMAGIGNPTIYRWAKGDGKDLPNPEQVLAFCDALDIPSAAAFTILWPGKNELRAQPEPIPMDADLQTLMRKLSDPNVSEFEREFIRETLRQLADRPVQRERPLKRTRRRGAAS